MFVKKTFDLNGLLLDLVMIASQYFQIISLGYVGASTTKNAKKTLILISKLLTTANETESTKLIKFLSQIQARNLEIQNIFFTIDWNILLAVRFCSVLCSFFISRNFQTSSTIVTYLVITCQFDAS